MCLGRFQDLSSDFETDASLVFPAQLHVIASLQINVGIDENTLFAHGFEETVFLSKFGISTGGSSRSEVDRKQVTCFDCEGAGSRSPGNIRISG
jgi:hypothetical protein